MTTFETDVKKFLLYWYDEPTWKQFIDHQKMGDCQLIVSIIHNKFPKTKSVFANIKTDAGKKIPHHWIVYCGKIYEFSKGTLKNVINWESQYDTDPENENRYWRSKRKGVL